MPTSNEKIRYLKGSSLLDAFKFLHKQICLNTHYALNSDFELVGKYPYPHIVARLDIKRPGEPLTFTEVIAYNEYKKRVAPVFIVEIDCSGDLFDPSSYRFRIWEYIFGDPYPDPPQVTKRLVIDWTNWEGFVEWEENLRKVVKNKLQQSLQVGGAL